MVAHSSILAWRISMDRGAWWAVVHGCHKALDTTEQLTLLPPLHPFLLGSPDSVQHSSLRRSFIQPLQPPPPPPALCLDDKPGMPPSMRQALNTLSTLVFHMPDAPTQL